MVMVMVMVMVTVMVMMMVMVMARYPDRTLVSPATAGAHTDWMDEFMAECELLGCRIDYLATHDYSKDRNATKTINVSC